MFSDVCHLPLNVASNLASYSSLLYCALRFYVCMYITYCEKGNGPIKGNQTGEVSEKSDILYGYEFWSDVQPHYQALQFKEFA